MELIYYCKSAAAQGKGEVGKVRKEKIYSGLVNRVGEQPVWTAGTIAIVYALLFLVWNLLGDAVPELVTANPERTHLLHLVSNLVFVVLSSLGLFLIIRYYLRRTELMRLELLNRNEQLNGAFEELSSAEKGLWQQYNELKVLTEALRNRDEDLSALFLHMHDAFAVHELIYDEQNRPVNYRYLEVNKAFESLVGISRSRIIGSTVLELKPRLQDYWIDLFGRVAATGIPATITHHMPEAGRHYSIMAYSPQQGRVAALMLDITAQKEQERQMRSLAYQDHLTGLPNRALFLERMELALTHCRRVDEKLTVLYMDLDNFKRINDALGQQAGDQLLQCTAERLLTCVEEKDTIARLGGDEFSLMLPTTEDSAAVAQRIIDRMQEPWLYQDQEFYVAASVGIAFFPDDGETADALLKAAGVAMCEAKNTGKNTYRFFNQKLHACLLRRMVLENDLHHAVARDELVVYYQPIMHKDGRIFGVEALVRWQHPHQGMLGPDAFIDLAEESGLIVGIGHWVLDTACRQVAALRQQTGMDVHLSVNLSAKQFLDSKLSDMVAKAMANSGLEPAKLELEITESVAMADAEISYAIMSDLRKLGISLALDDFGTGYSSLRYLKQFPIDTIKIDKSFVRDVHTDADDQAIIQAIIGLADSLRLKVVAEGVEKEEHWHYLQGEGCARMQGYLFNKPIPLGELGRWLKQYHAAGKVGLNKQAQEEIKWQNNIIEQPDCASISASGISGKDDPCTMPL